MKMLLLLCITNLYVVGKTPNMKTMNTYTKKPLKLKSINKF